MKYYETIGEELAHIASLHPEGMCVPSDVVKYAEDPKTKLHSRFTWDDEKAGHNYRLWQARQVIRLELKVITTGDRENAELIFNMPEKKVQTRQYVSLSTDRDSGGYRSIDVILEDEALRAQMVKDALLELQIFRAKYKSLKELAEVFAAIDRVSV